LPQPLLTIAYAEVMSSEDAFLRALDGLETALAENQERAKAMKRRIAQIRRQRANGGTWSSIVSAEQPPLVVQLVSESSRALDEHGSRVRRTEVLALHDEGMTMEQIAAKFGVTRQRVSSLLREARSDLR
jgi:DNA-directed RNA polymerase specialized sigma24 family protein